MDLLIIYFILVWVVIVFYSVLKTYIQRKLLRREAAETVERRNNITGNGTMLGGVYSISPPPPPPYQVNDGVPSSTSQTRTNDTVVGCSSQNEFPPSIPSLSHTTSFDQACYNCPPPSYEESVSMERRK